MPYCFLYNRTFDALIVDISNDKIRLPRSSNSLKIRINGHDILKDRLSSLHKQLRENGSNLGSSICDGSSNGSNTVGRRWSFFKSSRQDTKQEFSRTDSMNSDIEDALSSRPYNPYSISVADDGLCSQFCAIVNNHLLAIARRAATYTITDIREDNQRVSVLLEESFVNSYSNPDVSKKVGKRDAQLNASFVQNFINTQIFLEYYRGNLSGSFANDDQVM